MPQRVPRVGKLLAALFLHFRDMAAGRRKNPGLAFLGIVGSAGLSDPLQALQHCGREWQFERALFAAFRRGHTQRRTIRIEVGPTRG
jgi:hypothetical protein